MSRPLRIEYPGAWHHVMNRGRWSEKIFYTDQDRKSFIKVLQEAGEEPEEIERFYSLKNLPSIMGGESFKDMIRDKFASLLNRTEIPEAKTLVPDVERVIAAVCEFYGVSREELMRSHRGVSNPGRDTAIYLVRTLCRMSLPEAGQVFGINNYSSVSSAIQRVKGRLEKVKKKRERLEAIRQKVLKGQKRN